MTIGELVDPVEAMIDALGPEGMDRLCAAWLAKRWVVGRPALARAIPPGPARAKHYLEYVRELPCCRCQDDPPNDPHHFGPRGMGQKTDDYRTLPLCRICHGWAHDTGGQLKTVVRLQAGIIDTFVPYARIAEQT